MSGIKMSPPSFYLPGKKGEPKPVPGAIAIYRFDEGSGQRLTDYSGNGNHGTLGSTTGVDTNDPQWNEKGAVHLTDDYIQLPAGISSLRNITVMDVVTLSRLAMGGALNGFSSLYYLHNENNLIYLSSGSAYFIGSRPTINTPTVHTLVCPSSSTKDITYRRNLEQNLVMGNSESAVGRIALLKIGKGDGNLDGTFHMSLIYPFLLSDAQIAQNYAYIKQELAKKGVVLP